MVNWARATAHYEREISGGRLPPPLNVVVALMSWAAKGLGYARKRVRLFCCGYEEAATVERYMTVATSRMVVRPNYPPGMVISLEPVVENGDGAGEGEGDGDGDDDSEGDSDDEAADDSSTAQRDGRTLSANDSTSEVEREEEGAAGAGGGGNKSSSSATRSMIAPPMKAVVAGFSAAVNSPAYLRDRTNSLKNKIGEGLGVVSAVSEEEQKRRDRIARRMKRERKIKRNRVSLACAYLIFQIVMWPVSLVLALVCTAFMGLKLEWVLVAKALRDIVGLRVHAVVLPVHAAARLMHQVDAEGEGSREGWEDVTLKSQEIENVVKSVKGVGGSSCATGEAGGIVNQRHSARREGQLSLDLDTIEEVVDELGTWFEDGMEVSSVALTTRKRVDRIARVLDDQRRQLALTDERVKGQLGSLQETVKTGVRTLTQEVGSSNEAGGAMKQDMQGFKQELELVKGDVGLVKVQVEEVKDELGLVKGQVEEVKDGLGDISASIEKLTAVLKSGGGAGSSKWPWGGL